MHIIKERFNSNILVKFSLISAIFFSTLVLITQCISLYLRWLLQCQEADSDQDKLLIRGDYKLNMLMAAGMEGLYFFLHMMVKGNGEQGGYIEIKQPAFGVVGWIIARMRDSQWGLGLNKAAVILVTQSAGVILRVSCVFLILAGTKSASLILPILLTYDLVVSFLNMVFDPLNYHF